jgi:hypothetical protein
MAPMSAAMGEADMTLPAVAASVPLVTSARRTANDCTRSRQRVREGRAGRGLPGTSEENQKFLWGGASEGKPLGVGRLV